MSVKFDFEDLVVYQKAIDFADIAYRATKHFPDDERYGLSSQFQRAATGIALNIAEGTGGTKAEFKRFVRIALRSARECVAITEVASRTGYFDETQREFLREKLAELSRMLTGLAKSLRAGKDKDKEKE